MLPHCLIKFVPWLASLLLVILAAFAEARIPELRVTEEGSESSLPLVALGVQITLRGHLAKTEMNLTYSNQLDRDLQAEFLFPIPPSATLTDIGLYFDEKLRHAVAVEREKGRMAFDEIVHRRVDPALAEWMAGNTFRLDIYPVPANGTKTVYVAYEEDLTAVDRKLFYSLDLKYRKLLEDFSLSIDADESFEFRNHALPIRLDSGKSHFTTTNFYVDTQISLQSPQLALSFTEPSEKPGEYFISARIKNGPAEIEIQPVYSIVLFWDVSGSASSNNVDVVFEFLRKFLMNQQRRVQLTVIPFHMETGEPTIVNNASSPAGLLTLKRKLKSLIHAGGTDLVKLFDGMQEHLQNYSGDSRVLLVTDGFDSTHSSAQVLESVSKFADADFPILVISGSEQVNSYLLKGIAQKTKGWFALLNSDTKISTIVSRVQKLPFKITLDSHSPDLYDAILTTTPDGSFILTGKSSNASVGSDLTLRFSNVYSSQVKRISFEPRVLNGSSGIVQAAWARAKLDNLLSNSAEDSELLAHGLKYRLMTPQTSLIVLESWQDYEAYGIEMPEDVAKEYEIEMAEVIRESLIDAFSTSTSRPPPPECKNSTTSQINGVVTDDQGYPLPGVSVTAQSNGTLVRTSITDVCGEFTFNDLPTATYSLSANIEGFTEVTQEEVNVGESNKMQIHYSLRPSLAEEFMVVGASPAIHTTSSASSDFYLNFSDEPKEFFDTVSLSRDQMRVLLEATLERIATMSNADAKLLYVKSRNRFKTVPEFFLRTIQILQHKDSEFSDRILLDLTEFNTISPATYCMIARNFSKIGRLDLSTQLLFKALSISSSQSQTWRELGLMYAKAGMLDKAKESYLEALNPKNLDRFDGLADLIENEKTKLDYATSAIDLEVDYEMDLKVVLNWNSNYTDVDLHVIEPGGEEIFYRHTHSKSGGELSPDITEGFGPEIYRIKSAAKGNYQIYVKYYSPDDSSLSLSNIATVTVYVRDKTGKQTRTDYSITLSKGEERILAASIQF